MDEYEEIIHDLLVAPYNFDIELVWEEGKDWKKFRHAIMFLGRLRRDPNSHYRDRLDKEYAALPKSKDKDAKIATLDSLGWTPGTWKQAETVNELKAIKDVILGVNGNKPSKGGPTQLPFVEQREKNSGGLGSRASEKPETVHRSYTGAGKVMRLGDMDAEFFAAHDTSYT